MSKYTTRVSYMSRIKLQQIAENEKDSRSGKAQQRLAHLNAKDKERKDGIQKVLLQV